MRINDLVYSTAIDKGVIIGIISAHTIIVVMLFYKMD